MAKTIEKKRSGQETGSPSIEIRAERVTKEELAYYFRAKREKQHFVIDEGYHPRISLDFYYHEEIYEFFEVCRDVRIWDDKENEWIGRQLFREGREACGTEEEVYAAIQGLDRELFVVDAKEYEEYVNAHRLAFWKNGEELILTGEPVVHLKHPADYADESRRRPEFEMRPGRLEYTVYGDGPSFVFDEPIHSYSVYADGTLILKIGTNLTQLENIDLELVQPKKGEK